MPLLLCSTAQTIGILNKASSLPWLLLSDMGILRCGNIKWEKLSPGKIPTFYVYLCMFKFFLSKLVYCRTCCDVEALDQIVRGGS